MNPADKAAAEYWRIVDEALERSRVPRVRKRGPYQETHANRWRPHLAERIAARKAARRKVAT